MLMPKEAQDAMLDLRRVASELSTIRKELHEFKLLIAEQNDILRELSKPKVYTAAVDANGTFEGYVDGGSTQ